MPSLPAAKGESTGLRLLAWSLLLGSFLAGWAGLAWHGQMEKARERAAVAYHKDLGYRVWAAHGGEGDPGERGTETPGPTAPRRMVHRTPPDPEGLSTHLVSFAHLTREALPDPWETAALARLGARGSTFSEVVREDGQPELRFMGAFRAETGCLRCHPGARQGDVLGGIGIRTPLAPLSVLLFRGWNLAVLVALAAAWAAGLLLVPWFARRQRRQREREARIFQALHESEAHFREVAGATSDFTFACAHEAPDKRPDWVTEGFFALTGWSRGDLERHGCWRGAVHPEDREELERAFASLDPGQRGDREFRMVAQDGRIRWLRCRWETQVDPSGQPRHLGSAEDITERREAEELLAQNRNELRAVYDQVPAMLCIVNEQRRVLFANRAFEAFTGRAGEDLLARRLCEILGCPWRGEPDSRKCRSCRLGRSLDITLRSGESLRDQEHHLTVRHANWEAQVILAFSTSRISAPSEERVLLSMEDVTERRRADISIRNAEQLYHAIFQASPMGIFLVRHGLCLHANRNGLALLGRSGATGIQGEPLAWAFAAEGRETLRAWLDQVEAGQPGKALELEMARPNGTFAPTESVGVPVDLPDGPAVLVMVRDITGRKQAEALREIHLRLNVASFALGLEALLQRLLDEAETLTGSRIAFFHFPDGPEATTWSTRALRLLEGTEAEARDHAGCLEECLREGLPVIRNDRPEGPCPFERLLLIPILRGGRIAAVLGVGNKPADYAAADCALLEQFGDLAWDLIEAKRARETLAFQNERLRLALEATSDGIWDWDIAGKRVYWSPRSFEMLGYPAEARVVDLAIWEDLLHPEDRGRITEEILRQVAPEDGTFSGEYRLRCADGSHRWVLGRGKAVARDGAGKPTRILGTHVDLTDRKAAEDALREREHRLERLAQAAQEAILIHDAGRILDVNDAALRMVRAGSVQEVTGRHLLEFASPESRHFAVRALADPQDPGLEITARRLDGETFPARVRGARIEWCGRPVRVVTVLDLSAQRAAEAEVQERDRRLEALVMNLPGVVFLWRLKPDGQNHFDFLSPRAGEILDLSEGIEDPFTELMARVHPEEQERFAASIREAAEQRKGWQFDGRLVMRNGSPRWFHAQSYPVADGEDLVFHGLIFDTHDQMLALEARVESEAKFRAAFDQAAVGMAMTDAAGRILMANAPMGRLLGCDATKLYGQHFTDITWPEDHGRELELFQELSEGKRARYDLEKRYRQKDGNPVWVHIFVSGISSARSEQTRYFAVISDIDTRKRAELALQESETRFRELAEATPVLIFTFNESSVECTYMNNTWFEITGQPANEALGQGWRAMVHPEDLDGLLRGIQDSQARDAFLEQEFRVRTPSDEWRIIFIRSIPRRSPDGKLLGHVGTGVDITERKRGEHLASAMESILAKGRMAAYVAHEINSPLAGIKNAFMLLDDAIPKEHPHHHYVELIHREISRISNIVKTMYELYRPTAETPKEVNVAEALQEVVTLLAPKIRLHQVSVSVEAAEPGPRGTLKVDILRQVLFNVVQNAIEASPAGATITCRALGGRGQQIRLEVQDEGPGVPPELAERIWDSGFSTKGATDQHLGLGLGLATSRRLLEDMRGTISFRNHEGHPGCTFVIDLPSHATAARSTREEP